MFIFGPGPKRMDENAWLTENMGLDLEAKLWFVFSSNRIKL